MKKISLFPGKEDLQNLIQRVFVRFPLAICISILTTIIFFYLIAIDFDTNVSEDLWRIIMSGIIIFFLSIWVVLYSESRNQDTFTTIILQLCCIAFWGVFYYFLHSGLENIENVTFFILTLFGVVSLLFSAPYLKHLAKWEFREESYYIYFYTIASVLFMWWVVGWALCLGWGMAILALELLFDIRGSLLWEIFGYWVSLSLTFLAPTFALSKLPKKWTFENVAFSENTFFTFLIRYIAIPFIYVYFIILYSYSIKVLLNFGDWPKWEVSWMVIWFSLFWYAIYIFSYIFETQKSISSPFLIQLFRKYFPYIVFPQTAMLFYAIFLRVWQYDITMNRYLVIVFWLWLVCVSLYLIISRKKTLLSIPTILTSFILIISVWPWSIYHLPLERQTERLKDNLYTANILQEHIDGVKISPLQDYSDIDSSLSTQIYDGIDYVCNFDNCSKVKEIFPELYEEVFLLEKQELEKNINTYSYAAKQLENYNGPNKWQIVSHITETIKVQKNYTSSYQDNSIYLYNNEPLYPLDITGYDIFLEYNTYNIPEILTDLNTDKIFTSLREKYKNTSSSSRLSTEDRVFNIETDEYTGIFYVQDASISRDEDTLSKERQYVSGTVLLKKK